MAHRIEVTVKPAHADVAGEQIVKKAAELGLALKSCRVVDVYNIAEGLEKAEWDTRVSDAFSDRILQEARVDRPFFTDRWRIEIGYLPGITDNRGNTARQAIADAVAQQTAVHYSRMYALEGALDESVCRRLAHALFNPLVERCRIHGPGTTPSPYLAQVRISEKIRVLKMLMDPTRKSTAEIVQRRMLALNEAELKAMAHYFRGKRVLQARQKVGLDARITDVELEAIAQTWSEHCKHKIFHATIEYEEEKERHTIHGLFPVFIRGATEAVHKPYVVSVFKDNGGIIKFNPEYDIAIKVETHNAPSALDPYGGALTGVLGVQRDVLGTGLGAEPFAAMDMLCFAPPGEKAPPGALPPKRIFDGVVKGVEEAGNNTGVPTVNGSITFEKEFSARPLVFCGTVGIMPSIIQGRKTVEKSIRPGYRAVTVGGRIGKDGIHGATFSSQHIDESVSSSVVQIGDPITQKKTIDLVLEARDARLYEAITDNGAGGISSSVGELARLSGGCEIYLDQCPLKYPGLQPWEILVSESQERMTLAVPPDKLDALKRLGEKHEVEVSVVGTFTDSGYFHCLYKEKTVAYLDMKFLHEGVPTLQLKARWQRKLFSEPRIEETDLGTILKRLLACPNIASKECVVRRYDHEVGGGTLVKPVGGGVNDGAIVQPLLDHSEGVVIAHGLCPRVVQDSYAMAALAFDEAVRNALAVGGKFGYLAALDNFSWPDPVVSEKNPDGEYKLAQLVRACIAIYDVATAYGIPLVSGKDSMKNDYYVGREKYSILPTLVMTILGKIDDVRKAVTSPFKQAGDYIYALGVTEGKLGGSEYYKLFGSAGEQEPGVNLDRNAALYKALSKATEQGCVASLHDISDGGLAVALAESSMFSGWGMDVNLRPLVRETERDDALLFSENPGRFIASVREGQRAAFEKTMEGLPCAMIGRVRGDRRFIIRSITAEPLVNEDIRDLRESWERGVC